MEREFKFKVGQYVTFSDRLIGTPKYPCKIDYCFIDKGKNVYIINVSHGEKHPFIEEDLVLFVDNNYEYAFQQMERDMLALEKRITSLEAELINIKNTSASSSLSIKEVDVSKARKYEDQEGELYLSEK